MWQFEHTEHLWWWCLIPGIILLWRYLDIQQEKKLQKTGQVERIRGFLKHYSPKRRTISRSLYIGAIFFLVLAYANPQVGKKETIVRSAGADVVFALDLSNSMMATDLSPNRLEVAKKFISNMASQLSGDRVALIAFAGNAYQQLPFTTDYGALELYLSNLSTDLISKQGTAIGEAISTAIGMPGMNGATKGKVLVVLSDGEDHDSEALDNAKKAGDDGLTIFTIGVGTLAGGNIPERNEFGSLDYKRDKNGEVVWSKLNENMMKNLAQAGNGTYYNVDEGKKAVKDIVRKIRLASNATTQEKKYREFNHYFRIPLLIAIILLVVEWLYFSGWKRLFSQKKQLFVLILIGYTTISCESRQGAIGYKNNERGIDSFEQKNYSEALTAFKSASIEDSTNAIYYYNIANTFFKIGKKDSAIFWMEKAAQKISPKDTVIQAAIAYNLGCFYQTDYTKDKIAVDFYKQSLQLLPGNYKAQHNLSMLLKYKENQEQEQNQNEEQNKENQNQQQKDQQQKENKDNNQKENEEEQKKQSQKEEQQNKDKGNQQNEKPKPQSNQPKKSKLDPLQVQQLLQMLKQEEKAVQRRLFERNAEKSEQEYEEKDW